MIVYLECITLNNNFCLDDVMDHLKQSLKALEIKGNLKYTISQFYDVVENSGETYGNFHIPNLYVMKMLWSFAVLMKDNKSIVCSSIWKRHIDKQMNKKVSLNYVSIVWVSCIEEIKDVINKLKDKSITLSEIDHHFKKVPSNDLDCQLNLLIQGCNRYFEEDCFNCLVSDFVIEIDNYQTFQNMQSAANCMMVSKDVLQLTERFDQLEAFTKKVSSLTV